MKDDNRSYYRARAVQELTAALCASDDKIAAIHRALAVRYELLATGFVGEPQDDDEEVGIDLGTSDAWTPASGQAGS